MFMKKIFSIFILSQLISISGFAQSKFIRQNGTTYVYNLIGDLFNNLQNGDTVYLAGGNFNIGNITINNQITLFGAGHYPDSTAATYATILNGNIRLLPGANNSFFTGIYLSGDFNFGSNPSNNNVTQVEITRCNVQHIILNYDQYAQNSNVSFIQIYENWIRGSVFGMGAINVLIEKNLINGAIEHFANGNVLVKNNTFLGGAGCPAYQFNNVYNALIQNNIFMNSGACGNSIIGSASSCLFENNVFNRSYTFPYNTNSGVNNYMNISFTNFFVNENNFTLDYQSDYHMQNPTLYIGTDGSEVGIYGTPNPFKLGSVPINPHISSKNIATQTNSNGDLNIQIQVNAQNN